MIICYSKQKMQLIQRKTPTNKIDDVSDCPT